MSRRPFKVMSTAALIMALSMSCKHGPEKTARGETVDESADLALAGDWFSFDQSRVEEKTVSRIKSAGRFDRDKAVLIAGFGIQKAKSLDLGVYGKIGTTPVFVARKNHISDYDRLYWVMVRVLSEKYGCLIKGKTSSRNTVRFVCRDRRTVVIERSIDNDFAKFFGRQYDAGGREIIIKPKIVASVSGAKQL